MRLLRRSRPEKSAPATRSTSHAWLTYRNANGETLRIFNITRQPIDTEVTVGSVPYVLAEVGEQDLDCVLKPGDRFFRLMTHEERAGVVELRLKSIRKSLALQGGIMKPTAEIRAKLHRAYATQLVVAKQE